MKSAYEGAGFLSASARPLYEVKAGLFKGVAHPVRVRILELLAGGAEVSVGELLADTGLEASHLSQHLAVLRRHSLVQSERRGSQVYYRIAFVEVAELLHAARRLLTAVLESTRSQFELSTDLPEIPGVPEVPGPGVPETRLERHGGVG